MEPPPPLPVLLPGAPLKPFFLHQDDKKFYQLELVNRETNFNKVFNASPNVGVINPLIKVGGATPRRCSSSHPHQGRLCGGVASHPHVHKPLDDEFRLHLHLKQKSNALLCIRGGRPERTGSDQIYFQNKSGKAPLSPMVTFCSFRRLHVSFLQRHFCSS